MYQQPHAMQSAAKPMAMPFQPQAMDHYGVQVDERDDQAEDHRDQDTITIKQLPTNSSSSTTTSSSSKGAHKLPPMHPPCQFVKQHSSLLTSLKKAAPSTNSSSGSIAVNNNGVSAGALVWKKANAKKKALLSTVAPGKLYLRKKFATGQNEVAFKLGEFTIGIRLTDEIHLQHANGIESVAVDQIIKQQHEGPKLASLMVHHNNTRKQVWSSPPGVNFVGAASVSLAISESTADHSTNATANTTTHMQEQFSRQYNIQTIDNIGRGPVNVITISGRLAHALVNGEMESNSPHYSLAFKLHPQQGQALSFHLQVWGGGDAINSIQPTNAMTNAYIANQSQLFFQSTPHERFYGFGHRLSQCNAKGMQIQILHQKMHPKHGYAAKPETLEDCSSCTIPQYISSTGNCLFLHNAEPCTFDLRSSPNWVGVRVQSSSIKGVLLSGQTTLDAIQLYTSIRGRTKPLPGWTQRNGVILGLQGGSSAVKMITQRLLKYSCPVAGVLIHDWTGVKMPSKRIWYNWIMEREHYSHWHGLVDYMENQGISTGVYVNPCVEEIPVHLRSGRRYLFSEAQKGGYFIKTKGDDNRKKKSSGKHNGGTSGDSSDIYTVPNGGDRAGLIDLSNHNACTWYKGVIQSEVFTYAGASFYMADMGETAPMNGVYHRSDLNGLSRHNSYSEEWARVNREAIRDAGRDGDSFFIVKAGYSATPKHAGPTCLGDYVTNLKKRKDGGLKSVLNGIVNGGFSGFTYGHCAVSFAVPRTVNSLDNRSREMICRWMEMNAFTTLFRTHDGDNPDETASGYGDKYLLKALTRWATVYATLADYRIRLFNEASFRGYPVVRHPILHFPADENFMKRDVSSFMLGDSLYVAPVMECGAVTTNVYVPAGRWIHLWSGSCVANTKDEGAFVDVLSPLGEPPVFFRECNEMSRVVTTLKQKGIINLEKVTTSQSKKRFSLKKK